MNTENLWQIHDKHVINDFVKKIISEDKVFLSKLSNNSLKIGKKHFNRMRDTIVIQSKKKISVEDAEDALNCFEKNIE